MHSPQSSGTPSRSLYDRTFFLAFLANLLLVTANALTFRFAEFVKFLGGTEETTGTIVSVGLIGSLMFRAFLGQALDHFGVRKVWMTACCVYLLGCGLIITSTEIGPQIYLARTIFVIGLASMFACAVSYIQTRAPDERRTEIIGTFGSSGFLGMICGSQLGDIIFNHYPSSQLLYQVLFGSVLGLGIIHMILATTLTSGDIHARPSETPAIHKLLFRYWPPLVSIVTIMMGLGFSVTMVFLTRYSTELGLGGIRTFFTAYAISAFTTRILARQWSRVVGRHKLIVAGLAAHCVGQFCLTFVTKEWHFLPAALCCGFGHALLFPCVVSLGAGAFPPQYRGTGTAVTLAAVDVGTVISAPFLGWIIDHHGFHTMYYLVCGILGFSSVAYWFASSRVIDSDIAAKPVPEKERKPVRQLEPECASAK